MVTPNKLELLATCVIAVVLAAGSARGQGDGHEIEPAPPHEAGKDGIRLIRHTDILGTTVFRQQASGTEGAERRAPRRSEPTPIGTVWDIVFDARSGEVCYAVLALRGVSGDAGKKVVAWDALSWCAETARFSAALTSAALAALPEFDERRLHSLGDFAADGAGPDGGIRRSARADGGETANAVSRQPSPAEPRFVLASKVGDIEVHYVPDECGSGRTLFLEITSGAVAFLTVSARGDGDGQTRYLIPWKTLRLIETRRARDHKTGFRVVKTRLQLQGAPKPDDGNDVSKAEFRQRVYAYFEVDLPPFDARKAQRGHSGETRAHGGRRQAR